MLQRQESGKYVLQGVQQTPSRCNFQVASLHELRERATYTKSKEKYLGPRIPRRTLQMLGHIVLQRDAGGLRVASRA